MSKSLQLVVVQPFADYAKGDTITDADKVKAVLETHRHFVVPVNADAAATEPVTDPETLTPPLGDSDVNAKPAGKAK